MLRVGDHSPEVFERQYWRKKPVVVKGAASGVADVKFDAAEMRILCDRLDRVQPGIVTRRSGCLFGQNLDLGSPQLRSISERYRKQTGVRRVWFDGVVAAEGVGLGAHYDHSDNFVMQQTGVKRWRLGSPEHIEEALLRRRMLEDPSAGDYQMPPDAQEFILQPGDVLYIPLFWGHEGVSVEGNSTSLSLVINADSPLDALLPATRTAFDDDPKWWRPLPASSNDAALDDRLEALLDGLSDPERRPEIKRAWLAALAKNAD